MCGKPAIKTIQRDCKHPVPEKRIEKSRAAELKALQRRKKLLHKGPEWLQIIKSVDNTVEQKHQHAEIIQIPSCFLSFPPAQITGIQDQEIKKADRENHKTVRTFTVHPDAVYQDI